MWYLYVLLYVILMFEFQNVADQHKDWRHDNPRQIIYFSDPVISLNLPESQPLVVHEWAVVPITPPQVQYMHVMCIVMP